MRIPIAAGLLLSALAATACGHAVQINPKAEPVGNRWNASLATPAGLSGAIQVTGTAWMAPNEKDPSTTRVHVSIANASPGGLHPWHVHRGQCGTDQGIVGPPDSYHPLKVGGQRAGGGRRGAGDSAAEGGRLLRERARVGGEHEHYYGLRQPRPSSSMR